MHMGASRIVNLQRHRIAQCRSIVIRILGDEGVPVQVDGEAWLHPPGIIRIVHKNRVQLICRDKLIKTICFHNFSGCSVKSKKFVKLLYDEGVPVQVDGEAWLHPPGIIRIVHKNRVQLICRDKVLKPYVFTIFLRVKSKKKSSNCCLTREFLSKLMVKLGSTHRALFGSRTTDTQ